MRIEDIKKNSIFTEDEAYVADLISTATEKAISQSRIIPMWQRSSARIAASIALVVSLGCSGWMYMKRQEAQAAPLETFLSSITDEETAMLDYFYVEDLYIDEM